LQWRERQGGEQSGKEIRAMQMSAVMSTSPGVFAPQKKKQGKKAKPRSDFQHVEETATQRQPRRTDHSGATALDSHQLPGFAAAIVLVSVLASVLASRYARPAAYRPDHYGFVLPDRNQQESMQAGNDIL
jgi:hypothetical protein